MCQFHMYSGYMKNYGADFNRMGPDHWVYCTFKTVIGNAYS